MARTPLIKKLRRRARALRSRAVDELLASESRANALGAAVRRVQRGRRTLDQRSAKLLGALGLATQEDLERLQRRVARLRKRLRGVADMLAEERTPD